MVSEIEVSIIIPAWNACDYLRKGLQSLENHFPAQVQHEVIVVDNASEDGTVAMIREEFPTVTLIKNSTNEGPVSARHLGVAQAKGSFFLFVDSDIELLANTWETMHTELVNNTQIGFLTCNKQSPDGYPQRSWFDAPTLGSTLIEMIPGWRRKRIEQSRKAHDRACFPDWISTGHSLVRRAAWEAVGGQNRSVFFFGEEIEFCHKLRTAGWEVRFIPHMGFIHHGSVSQRGHEDRFRKLSWLGMIWIADLYWPFVNALLLRVVLLIRGLLVCLKKILSGHSPFGLFVFLPRLFWPIPLREVRL